MNSFLFENVTWKSFVEVFKNLARYKSENNFIGFSIIIYLLFLKDI